MGLAAFVAVAALPGSVLSRAAAALVAANGVACHGTALVGHRWRGLAHHVDVLCNVALCALVNVLSHAQPATLGLTLVALCAWVASRAVGVRPLGTALHVLGVQARVRTLAPIALDAQRANTEWDAAAAQRAAV